MSELTPKKTRFLNQVNSLLQSGMTLEQVAEHLEMPVGTVASRIYSGGYRVRKRGELVPQDAPELDTCIGTL